MTGRYTRLHILMFYYRVLHRECVVCSVCVHTTGHHIVCAHFRLCIHIHRLCCVPFFFAIIVYKFLCINFTALNILNSMTTRIKRWLFALIVIIIWNCCVVRKMDKQQIPVKSETIHRSMSRACAPGAAYDVHGMKWNESTSIEWHDCFLPSSLFPLLHTFFGQTCDYHANKNNTPHAGDNNK